MDLASVVAALASVGVRVSGSTPNNNIQGDSSRACPTGLAGPEPSGTLNNPGQHFHGYHLGFPMDPMEPPSLSVPLGDDHSDEDAICELPQAGALIRRLGLVGSPQPTLNRRGSPWVGNDPKSPKLGA